MTSDRLFTPHGPICPEPSPIAHPRKPSQVSPMILPPEQSMQTSKARFRLWLYGFVTIAGVGIGACAGGTSVEDARKAVVVDAEGAQLTGEMLERYLLKIAEPPSRTAAALVVSAWIDVALLQHAVSQGVDLADSAMVDLALHPDASRGILTEFAAERYRARPVPTDAQADSVFELGWVRVFQQVLFAGDVRDTSLAMRTKLKFAMSTLDRARSGSGFDSLVAAYSEDTVFKAGGGYLPGVEWKDLPPSIARATWGLAPNEVSNLTPSPRGAHVFRRATMIQSRAGLREWVAPRLAALAHAAYLDSVRWMNEIKVADDGVDRLRQLATDPMQVTGGDGPLVTWKGGGLSPEVARLWLAVVPPRDRVNLSGAADSAITSLLTDIARQEVLMTQLAPAGVPTPVARAALAPQYRASLDELLAAWKAVGAGRPLTAATAAVLDTVAGGKVAYRPPPGALASILRARAKVTVNQGAIDAIVSEAALERARREAVDSGPTSAQIDSAKRDSTFP